MYSYDIEWKSLEQTVSTDSWPSWYSSYIVFYVNFLSLTSDENWLLCIPENAHVKLDSDFVLATA